MSKLVEQVVVKQLMQHINSNTLDNPHQSVYITVHSTEAALLHNKNEIHLSLSPGEPTALVLLDLLAAFDTIDHDTLMNYLKSWFGVQHGHEMVLYQFQAVKIWSALSELHELLLGVPQGFVLGPLLFSLYNTLLSKVMHIQYQFRFLCR